MIVVAPIFDDVTEITYEESRAVVKYASEHNIDVIDLAKADAVRWKVEETLREYPNLLVYHADHGNESSWFGNDEQPCVSSENVKLLADRECYCNNCSSAKRLGVEAYHLGATYWGYTDLFVFTTDALEEFELFINNGIKRKIDGLNWRECLEATKELANLLIDKLIQAGKALAASCLRWDCDHLHCWGENVEDPPAEDCPVSRFIVRLFGYRMLFMLRRFRDKLFNSS